MITHAIEQLQGLYAHSRPAEIASVAAADTRTAQKQMKAKQARRLRTDRRSKQVERKAWLKQMMVLIRPMTGA